MFGAIDATSKDGEGQSRMEAEIEECVPAFPAYPDGTVGNRDFTLKSREKPGKTTLVHGGNSRLSAGLGVTHPKEKTMRKIEN